MKLIIIVPDGMCDLRYTELGGLSPVEHANTPGIDALVRGGQIGLAKTMHDGLPLGSLVGIMGIFGYNPPEYVPRGRSIFEAYTLGVKMQSDDLVSRCNIVHVSDGDILEDFTAGQISDADAAAYLASLKLPPLFEIYHDNSYRNVLIHRDFLLDDVNLDLFEPHENMGRSIHDILPRYRGEQFQPFSDMMRSSRRGNLMLWPWGAGRIRSFTPMPFRSMTVTALSFLYGMATLLGGKAVIPPGATGYLGSNLSGKLQAALASLDEVDVCLIHLNAPDEEAHVHNLMGKVRALEEIDSQVIQPLLAFLKDYRQPCRVFLLADHYTLCGTGKHLPDLVPYAAYGHGLSPNHTLSRFSEAEIVAAEPPIILSHDLIRTHLAG